MGEYYRQGGERKIILYFVGEGPEIRSYKKITKSYQIENNVFFCGRMHGQELDDLYNQCDIALSSFGWYKCKVYLSSALKVREYLAKGLPVISGAKEDVFIGHAKRFYMEFPNDKSLIDFNKVVRFYDELYQVGENREKLQKEIRQFAEERVDMKITMKPIKEYLERSAVRSVYF